MILQLLMLVPLTGCNAVPINLDKSTLRLIAPDVPEISITIQRQAAAEMQGGQSPALNYIANTCLATRDEARILKNGGR